MLLQKKSKIFRNGKTRDCSLRTTVPAQIVNLLDISEGQTLIWNVDLSGDEIVLTLDIQ
jgi:hypothetical protein